jgi:uncharacterized protein YjiS (DUF1127 family)
MGTSGTAPGLAGWPAALEMWPARELWRLWWHAGVVLARKAGAQPARWRQRARQRRELLRMGPRELRDVGLSPWDALQEGGKHFWQI